MKKLKNFLSSFMASTLIWLFPVIFLYAQNVKEVQFTETLKADFVLIGCVLIGLFIGLLLFKDWYIAGVFNSISGLMLGNFAFLLNSIQKVFTAIRYWHMLMILLAISILIGVMLHKHIEICKTLINIFTIAFGALILFNLVSSVPTIITKIQINQDNYSDTQDKIFDKENLQGRSNIYYLLCDEYASFEQMNTDMGFKNDEFKNFLTDSQFNISESSHNDSAKTVVVMANIMALDYVADSNTTALELDKITKNGEFQKILTSHGYTLRGIGDTTWLGIEGTVASKNESVTADGKNFTQIALEKSFIGAFIQKNYEADALKIVNSFKQLKTLDIIPDSSVFTMFYVSAPHHPYYFKSNGTLNPPDKYFNYDGKNKDSYIEEVKYINSELKIAIKKFLNKDPNSIIILCSDHGNRFGNVSGTHATQILNAVYYKGMELKEIEGMSGVNTMRFIFNKELGLNMPFKELPN